MTEMAETHVELNQFPVPRVGPRHSTLEWKRERAKFLHQLERDIFQAKFTKHGMYSRKIYKKWIMEVRVT